MPTRFCYRSRMSDGSRHATPDLRRAAAETVTKYIITDMYAKAIQGMAPEEAVKWAHGELAKIYA